MALMSPSQISSPNFPLAGRGAYRTTEVDAFMQRVAYAYNELLQENAELKNKFASLSSIIEEYNAGKNAIASALLKAETSASHTVEAAKAAADQILGEASAKAQTLIREKTQEAETYATEKKAEADAYYQKLQSEMQRVMQTAETQSRQYAEDINAQAAHIIADANEKAAAIVAAAYKDAQAAQEKTEEIISRAQVEIETTRNSIASFKEDALSALSKLLPMIEGIPVEDFTAPALSADAAEIPQVEAEAAEAKTLDLGGLFETIDTTPDAPAAAPAAEEVVQPEEVPAEEPAEEAPSLFTFQSAPQAPAAPAEDASNLFTTFQSAPQTPAAPAEDASNLFTTSQSAPQAPAEEPAAPQGDGQDDDIKFHLMGDFNIFDD